LASAAVAALDALKQVRARSAPAKSAAVVVVVANVAVAANPAPQQPKPAATSRPAVTVKCDAPQQKQQQPQQQQQRQQQAKTASSRPEATAAKPVAHKPEAARPESAGGAGHGSVSDEVEALLGSLGGEDKNWKKRDEALTELERVLAGHPNPIPASRAVRCAGGRWPPSGPRQGVSLTRGQGRGGVRVSADRGQPAQRGRARGASGGADGAERGALRGGAACGEGLWRAAGGSSPRAGG
jgi:hypothetical protein